MLYHITAKHKIKNISVDLYYKSIKESRERNPGYYDFRYVGVGKW